VEAMEYSEAAGRQEAVVPNQWNLISEGLVG